MYQGGRGGNRRSFEPKQDYRQSPESRERGFKKEFSSPNDRKTEWISYKRPPASDTTPNKDDDKAKVAMAVSPTSTPVSNEVKITPKSEEETIKPADEQEVSNGADSYAPSGANVTPKPGIEHSRSPISKNTSEQLHPKSYVGSSTSSKDSPLSREQKPHEYSRPAPATSTSQMARYTGKQGEKKFSGRCRLFVANMNNSTTEEELRTLFGEFGETGEVYVNKEKGFGFIRLDYRHNAEMAKSCLDKKLFKGRNIQVRFATHASAVELHGLDHFASNEYIEKAMSQFGTVERAVVVCDDRGRSKGYGIVEFEWKKSAQKVIDRFKEEMFVIGRLPKPVFAKPLTQQDDEEGIHEAELERSQGYKIERDFTPRFISPSSFEYTWAKKWRDLFIEEEDKKAKLEQELQDARYSLELEMEAAIRQQEAGRIREELLRRQEELRRLEEDMRRRQEMDMRAREQLGRNRDRGYDNRRTESPRTHHRDQPPPRSSGGVIIRGDLARQNELILQQQAELEFRRGEILRAAGVQPAAMLGIRPGMLRPTGMPIAGLASLPPHAIVSSLPGGLIPGGPRGPLPPGIPMQGLMRPHMIPGGPLSSGRDGPPRAGDHHFEHKRPRRD